MRTRSRTRLFAVTIAAFALLTAACSSDSDGDSDGTTGTTGGVVFAGPLTGVLGITAGACTDGKPTGSYFQMVQAGGTAEAGPFVPNPDSACSDTNYTLLTAGTDGGLKIGDFQPPPDPAFDDAGNGLADAITTPVKFMGVDFATATDPQGIAPVAVGSDGVLSANVSGFTAYYGGGTFNQGAPKADGTGIQPTGVIESPSGNYTLNWVSEIKGGSFDGFIGVWHLEGTFTPSS